MKIPKSLKLPRKLKKEMKKGFTKIVKPIPLSRTQMLETGFMVAMQTKYAGSNTKSFRRLCKFARMDEKRMFEQMAKDAINSMNFNFDDDVEDMLMSRMVFPKLRPEHLKQFQKQMFCEPIPKPVITNIPDIGKILPVHVTATCYLDDLKVSFIQNQNNPENNPGSKWEIDEEYVNKYIKNSH